METKIRKPRLINARKMSLKFPDRFSYWEEDINNLKEGEIVKVCNGWERFWVVVREINGDKLIGEVNNNLIGSVNGDKPSSYNFKDLISFKKENIYQVWSPDDIQKE